MNLGNLEIVGSWPSGRLLIKITVYLFHYKKRYHIFLKIKPDLHELALGGWHVIKQHQQAGHSFVVELLYKGRRKVKRPSSQRRCTPWTAWNLTWRNHILLVSKNFNFKKINTFFSSFKSKIYVFQQENEHINYLVDGSVEHRLVQHLLAQVNMVCLLVTKDARHQAETNRAWIATPKDGMQGLREHFAGALFNGRRRQVGAFKVEPELIRPMFVSVVVHQLSGHHVPHLASGANWKNQNSSHEYVGANMQKCAHLGVEIHEFGRERAAQLLIWARVLHSG